MKKADLKQGKIVIYKTSRNNVALEVKLEKETVWLTQSQIALLFGTQRPAITKHLNNIFKSGELNKDSVGSILEHTASDGKTYKTRFYNLDAIISVGYRVNSQRATQFRIWASNILKQYLINGYAINEKRILEAQSKFSELQEAVLFLQKQSQKELLKGQETTILNLLADYSKTLSLLEQYDKGKIHEQMGKKTSFVLQYKDCVKIIAELKKELIAKKEAGNLFGMERDGSFAGIIKGLYQTFDKKGLYPTIEDKAAHLLYLTTKDHPFTDGNKRTASFLFVYFLDRSNYLFKKTRERKINDNALAALTLLIAESDPKDKETMVKLIKSLTTG